MLLLSVIKLVFYNILVSRNAYYLLTIFDRHMGNAKSIKCKAIDLSNSDIEQSSA